MSAQEFLTEERGWPGTCDHRQHVPAFNEPATQGKPPEWVRQAYPAFTGLCKACGRAVKVWASMAHRRALNDWEPPVPPAQTDIFC